MYNGGLYFAKMVGKFGFIFLTTSVPTDYINLFCSENGGTNATGVTPAAG